MTACRGARSNSARHGILIERNIVEQNSEHVEIAADAVNTPEPLRRRSRRASVAAGEPVAAVTERGAPEPVAVDAAAAETAAAESAAAEAPKQRVSRARKKAAVASEAPETNEGSAPNEESGPNEGSAPTDQAAAEEAAPKKRSTRSRKTAAAEGTAAESTATDSAAAEGSAAENTGTAAGESTDTVGESAAESAGSTRRSSRSRAKAGSNEQNGNDSSKAGSNEQNGNDSSKAESKSSGRKKKSDAESTDSRAEAAGDQPDGGSDSENKENKKNGNSRNGRGNRGEGDEGGQRQGRTRQRERKRRGQSDDLEPEITEDDVLLPIAGILDVLDNYAFVRTSGYLPGTNDVYVSLGQVRKYGLRRGDSVVGAIRQPREGDTGGRQKYNAIVRVDTINSKPVEENQTRVDFADLTPIHPTERLRLETGATDYTQRVIDLFAPIGKGQRGIISGPQESGKSTALRQIAAAVAANQPDAHLMLVLIDERPEDVTELTRTVNGEVIASTFDRGAEDHVTLSELAIERAKRLVELGHDVIVLIDSLTSLARSFNALSNSRVPAGTLDANALFPVKKLLGAARNVENGGSLTIIATASDQPGSRVDEAVMGELAAATNMQLRLSGSAAERRVFPAVNLTASVTRNEHLLTSEAETKVMNQLRRSLAENGGEAALDAVLERLGETSSNVEFLALTQRTHASA